MCIYTILTNDTRRTTSELQYLPWHGHEKNTMLCRSLYSLIFYSLQRYSAFLFKYNNYCFFLKGWSFALNSGDNKVSPLTNIETFKLIFRPALLSTNRYRKALLTIEAQRISCLDSQKKLEVTWWALLTSVNTFSWNICKCSQRTWCKRCAVSTESRSEKSGNIIFYRRVPMVSSHLDSFCIGTDRTPTKKKCSFGLK